MQFYILRQKWDKPQSFYWFPESVATSNIHPLLSQQERIENGFVWSAVNTVNQSLWFLASLKRPISAWCTSESRMNTLVNVEELQLDGLMELYEKLELLTVNRKSRSILARSHVESNGKLRHRQPWIIKTGHCKRQSRYWSTGRLNNTLPFE